MQSSRSYRLPGESLNSVSEEQWAWVTDFSTVSHERGHRLHDEGDCLEDFLCGITYMTYPNALPVILRCYRFVNWAT